MQNSLKITKGWPPKRRREYAARIKRTKIWLASTGPRTAKGKSVSCKNSHKHGTYAAEWKALRASFRAHRQFLQAVRMRFEKRRTVHKALTSLNNFSSAKNCNQVVCAEMRNT